MSIEDTYSRSAEQFADRLRQVPTSAWDVTTHCCPDWKIRDLVNHVVNENRWIPPLLGGETVSDVGDRFDGDLLGADPVRAYSDAAREVIDAIRAPGALSGKVALSSGPTPAERYLAEVLSDQIIHTWDVASSIGVDDTLPTDLVDFAGATLRPLAEQWRAAGVLGPPLDVPDSADELTRLLALLGRARDQSERPD